MKTNVFFCLSCNNAGNTKDNINHKDCPPTAHIVEAEVTWKIARTWKQRFLKWLYSRDIGLGLAMLGAIVLNAMAMDYFSLSLCQSILEGICFGLVITRILK